MKKVFLIKKEDPLPDWGIFKKLNRKIWQISLGKILKNIKNGDLVVTDYVTKLELDRHGIKSKIFGDYIPCYEDKYPSAISIIRKWFGSKYFRKIKEFDGLDLGFIIEEEFAYFLDDILDQVSVIQNILKKENPEEIVIPGDLGLFNRSVIACAEKRKIPVNKLVNLKMVNFMNRKIRSLNLSVRFHNIPGINRREFVKTKKVENSQINRIMLLGMDNLYFGRLGKIPEELQRENLSFFSICTNRDTQEMLKKKAIDFFSFGDFVNKKIKMNINQKSEAMIKEWKILKNDDRFRNLFSYGGVNLFSIIKEEMDYIIQVKFPNILYYIETSRNCFESQKVNMVVAIDDLIAVTRAIVVSAKQKNIPTLVVQHGFTGIPSGQGYLPLTADKIAVWGKKSKEWLRKKGIANEKIVLTGNPQLDMDPSQSENKEKNYLGLDKNKKIILLATQAFGDMISEKESMELVKNIISILPRDKQLVIKIHPRERPDLYENIIKETGAKNVFVMKDNLQELLSICEAVITINSAVALDALCLGKPVIIADFFRRDFEMPYIGGGITNQANNMAQLEAMLKKIPRIKIKKKIVEDIVMVGNAGKRVVNLIKNMIR